MVIDQVLAVVEVADSLFQGEVTFVDLLRIIAAMAVVDNVFDLLGVQGSLFCVFVWPRERGIYPRCHSVLLVPGVTGGNRWLLREILW